MTKRNEALAMLRTLDADGLNDYLRQQRRKLFEIRLQQATGQVDNFRQIREIHKELARTMTVQYEVAHSEIGGVAVVEQVVEEKPKAKRARKPKAEAEEIETEVTQDGETDD